MAVSPASVNPNILMSFRSRFFAAASDFIVTLPRSGRLFTMLHVPVVIMEADLVFTPSVRQNGVVWNGFIEEFL
jgi:hypothetical protein